MCYIHLEGGEVSCPVNWKFPGIKRVCVSSRSSLWRAAAAALAEEAILGRREAMLQVCRGRGVRHASNRGKTHHDDALTHCNVRQFNPTHY